MNIILKLSGEALNSDLTEFITNLKDLSINNNIGIVIGGGNIFRGRENMHMDEVNRDLIGMLASVQNALKLNDLFSKSNIPSIITTPFDFNGLIKKYTDDEIYELSQNNIIIFAGGVGKCGVSTDTKCATSANVIKSNLIVKLTKVDGLYDKDPFEYKDSKFIKEITYDEYIKSNLKVFDETGIILAKKYNITIKIMNFNDTKNILNDKVGSYIR